MFYAKNIFTAIFFCLVLLFGGFQLKAEETETEISYLEFANIATGHPQSKFEAPSTVTVITAEEIKNIGARTVLEALRLVPGLIVGLDISGIPIVSLRGVYSAGSERILFLLNGIPVNNPLTGGGTLFFADLSVDKIERIEVIRGPGSVLYGSEAFTGVINIVLKRDYLDHLGYWRGTYDFDEINLALDKKNQDSNLWFDFVHRDKNSSSLFVKRDRFSVFPLFSLSKNLPRYHHTSDWERRQEIYTGFSWKDLVLDILYVNHASGIPYNLSGVPSNKSRFARQNFMVNLFCKSYFKSVSIEQLFHFSYYYHDLYADFYPRGSIIKDVSDNVYYFPYGLKWRRKTDIYRLRYELKSHYNLGDHRLFGGLVFQNDAIGDPKYYENVIPCSDARCYSNIPYLVDLSDIFGWIRDRDRFYYSFYLQDEYAIRKNIFLTLGMRYDWYDDFGDNLSFRAGLVFNLKRYWYLKILYGEGFRAPSFRELYLKSCPVLPRSGNPSLDAEEMESYEIGLFYSSPVFQFGITYFYHNYDDLIYLAPDKFFNFYYKNSSSDAHTQGVEIEGKYIFGKLDYLLFSYAYFDHSNAEGFHCVPYHVFSFNFFKHLLRGISFDYKFYYLSSWPSYHIEDYSISDLIVRYINPRYEFTIGVYNIWDHHYKYPDLSRFYIDNYLNPGRTFGVKLQIYF